MTPPAGAKAQLALGLALAVVESSSAPMLLLDGDLTVVAASMSFYRAFGVSPGEVKGRAVRAIGNGEWDIRQLQSLLRATAVSHAQIEAYEMDLIRPGEADRRLVLNAHKLEYGDKENVRLLLSIADVTDARLGEKLRDDMLREKAVLLQELQHRVANSLQIIASVLMQSAKRVQSDETRKHLYDAHSRIMSVADVQKQLAVSTLKDVELRGYFEELCHSLGASMIRDHEQIAIKVRAETGTASADRSVSLGLVVTELVINALKHAFPGQRKGEIVVEYRTTEEGWSLTVSDNGVGMPADPASAKPGLGTSIVQALARQLDAVIVVEAGHPGTVVSVLRHNKIKTAPARAV